MEERGKITVTDRKTVELTGIEAVENFDETLITLKTAGSTLVVEGETLRITVLDLEKGVVAAEGHIDAVIYRQSAPGRRSWKAKLFGKD